MTRRMTGAALLALVGLAACGGGGGGGAGGGAEVTFDGLSQLGTRLVDDYANAAATPVENLPSGRVTYRGAAAYRAGIHSQDDILAAPDSLSVVRFNADFASGMVSGAATDFRASDGASIEGSLRFEDAPLQGSVFASPIGGSLTTQGVRTDYAGTLVGEFVGPDAPAISGSANAIVSVGGVEQGTISAVFGAER